MMFKLVLITALVLFTNACSRHEIMRGANFLQDETISFDNIATRESLHHLKQLGANTVAVVTFLRQQSSHSINVLSDPYISDVALRKTIRWAKELGLMVILKPQILLEDGWAGTISPDDWDQWFASYGDHLKNYAVLAEEEHVDRLAIGTEITQAAKQPQWEELIRQLRSKYHGHLSYVAHGTQGINNFAYWHALDSAGVTLYPSLGETSADSYRRIKQTTKQLKTIKQNLSIPVWVAEVGIASRSLAKKRPWAWKNLSDDESHVDTDLQKEVISMWLDALSVQWLDGVVLWAWYSNPNAGGASDISFTVQNKPAEKIIACHWIGHCQ